MVVVMFFIADGFQYHGRRNATPAIETTHEGEG